MQCRDFREFADEHLGDEKSIDTEQDALDHLVACPDCRRELAARREIFARLRAGFAQAEELQVREEFVHRLRAQLRALRSPQPQAIRRQAIRVGGARRVALAACLVAAVLVGLKVTIERRPSPVAPSQGVDVGQKADSGMEQSKPLQSDEAPAVARSALAAHAAGVHSDCAIAHRVEEAPINLEEAGRRYDRAFLKLAQAATSRQGDLGGQVELLWAHSCVFGGRRYGHVALEHRGRIISALVTSLERPGAAAASAPAPSAGAGAKAMSCSQAGGYKIACFETARHAIFIISDLAEAENLTVARHLTPAIYNHVTRAESGV